MTARRLGFLTLLVASSCMIYELVLAQLSTLLLGSALTYYSVTISIYLASLGFGSLLYQRFGEAKFVLPFAEFTLTMLGTAAPILALVGEGVLRSLLPVDTPLFHLALQCGLFSLIGMIGILSGVELPILMELAEKQPSSISAGVVLALDYAGSFLAIVIFPLVMFENLGLIGVAALGGLGSSVAFASTAEAVWVRGQRFVWALPLFPAAVLFFAHPLSERLSTILLVGGFGD